MPRRLQLTIGDRSWAAEVSGPQVTLDPSGNSIRVESTDGRLRAEANRREFTGNAVVTGDAIWVTVEGEVFVIDAGQLAKARGGHDRHGGRDHAAFMPPMSATVVRIAVKPGDTVHDGDVLISLEAMKMELPIRAPRDGVVRTINCREGDLVQPDQVLLELE